MFISSQLKHTLTKVEVAGEELVLHPVKMVYRPKDKSLVCADLHIGKVAHFRKHGIPLPAIAHKNNFWNLSGVLETFMPDDLVILGDMVHSTVNHEWDDFLDFLGNYPGLRKTLVKGNHELYADRVFEQMGFRVMQTMDSGNFHFTHKPSEETPGSLYNLSGHIHPAISLSGRANQHLKVPCFYFGKHAGILPAFGEFTGTHVIRPKNGDQVFAIVENKVLRIGN